LSSALRNPRAPADECLVTIFARRFQPRAISRPQTLLSAVATALCLSLSLLCSSASALVTEAEGNKIGLQPREVARYTEGVQKLNGEDGPVVTNLAAKRFEDAGGNPVVHSVGTYTIFWDPQFFYHAGWRERIEGFMSHAATAGSQLESVFAVDGQYTDSTNQPAASHFSFLGGYNDTNAYPETSGCTDPRPFESTLLQNTPLIQGLAVCLTPTQVRSQLETFIAQHKLPKGLGTVYYLLTPPGVAACLDTGGVAGHCSEFASTPTEIEEDEKTKKEKEEKSEPYVEPAGLKSYKNSFCSYHGAIGNGNSSTILYGMIPWTAGGAGDYQLAVNDTLQGYPCQDGGFETSTKPNREALEKERLKTKSLKEEQEFDEKKPEEKRQQEESESLGLRGPHNEEPNQLGSARGEDGSFDEGLADLIINQIAVEQQNIVTDPLLNAWHDTEGKELTDECRNFFLPKIGGGVSANPETLSGTLSNQLFAGKEYYLNDAFNLSALELNFPGVPCLSRVHLEPQFTVPAAVNAGELVGMDGIDSDISLNWADHFTSGSASPTYATFTWNFGDGSPTVSGYAPAGAAANSPASSPCAQPWLSPCAGSVFHSYQYGGTYNVTLTVTDVAGNTASVTHQVTVLGQAAPSKEEIASKSESATSSSSSSTGSSESNPTGASSPGAAAPAVVPAPVAQAAILSHSLASTLKSGLVVRYSVNEQVAGHFEVLLSASIAHRLGISGTRATGLPAGTPAELVIAKAILITTKGGHSTVDIQFTKRTAARLGRLHKVSLLLRLIVRNAASHNPTTTTVLTPITLGD
jgi:hypothetical protein